MFQGGANVEAVRQESGARISISKAQASAPERIVTITGGQTQIRKACELITEKINKVIQQALSFNWMLIAALLYTFQFFN